MPGRRTENPGRKKCLCPSTSPHCRSGNNRSPALQQKSGYLLSWSHLPFTHSQLRNRKEAVCKEITRAKGGSSDLLANSVQFLLLDRKSTRLNSSHSQISYAVFCLKK